MIACKLCLDGQENAHNHKDEDGEIDENSVFLVKENAQKTIEEEFFKRGRIIVHLVCRRVERSLYRVVIEFKDKKQEDKENEVIDVMFEVPQFIQPIDLVEHKEEEGLWWYQKSRQL